MELVIWKNKDVFEEEIFDYVQGKPCHKDVKVIEVEGFYSKGDIFLLEDRKYSIIDIVNGIAIAWEIDRIPITVRVFKILNGGD